MVIFSLFLSWPYLVHLNKYPNRLNRSIQSIQARRENADRRIKQTEGNFCFVHLPRTNTLYSVVTIIVEVEN